GGGGWWCAWGVRGRPARRARSSRWARATASVPAAPTAAIAPPSTRTSVGPRASPSTIAASAVMRSLVTAGDTSIYGRGDRARGAHPAGRDRPRLRRGRIGPALAPARRGRARGGARARGQPRVQLRPARGQAGRGAGDRERRAPPADDGRASAGRRARLRRAPRRRARRAGGVSRGAVGRVGARAPGAEGGRADEARPA